MTNFMELADPVGVSVRDVSGKRMVVIRFTHGEEVALSAGIGFDNVPNGFVGKYKVTLTPSTEAAR